MMMYSWRTGGIVLVCLAACQLGCGSGSSDVDLEAVSGTVTLDGEPLADASVVFSPKVPGHRQGFGMTDSDGDYTIEFTSSSSGVPPGEYTVAIRTFRAPEEDPETGQMSEVVPERVPNVYHTPSKLTVTVPGGEYDFALESSAGEIVEVPALLDDEAQ